jgi:hypothetical protein
LGGAARIYRWRLTDGAREPDPPLGLRQYLVGVAAGGAVAAGLALVMGCMACGVGLGSETIRVAVGPLPAFLFFGVLQMVLLSYGEVWYDSDLSGRPSCFAQQPEFVRRDYLALTAARLLILGHGVCLWASCGRQEGVRLGPPGLTVAKSPAGPTPQGRKRTSDSREWGPVTTAGRAGCRLTNERRTPGAPPSR